MTRDAKRLRRLVDLRRRQEETARVQLAQSLQKAAEISDEVRVRSEALEAALAGNPEPRRKEHLEALLEIAQPALNAAQAAEASARGAAEEIRREWRRTAKRLKGMERLDDRHEAEQLAFRRRADQAHFDDALSSRSGEDDS